MRYGASACMLAPWRKMALPLSRMRVPSTRIVAKADVVGEFVFAGGEFDLVELWRLGRPEIELAGLDAEGRVAFCVGLDGGLGAGFGNVEVTGVPAGAPSTWT